MTMVENIKEALIEADPEHKEGFALGSVSEEQES
mgnify:CR=1 FL=1